MNGFGTLKTALLMVSVSLLSVPQIHCYQPYRKFDPYPPTFYMDRQMFSQPPVERLHQSPLHRGPLTKVHDGSQEIGFPIKPGTQGITLPLNPNQISQEMKFLSRPCINQGTHEIKFPFNPIPNQELHEMRLRVHPIPNQRLPGTEILLNQLNANDGKVGTLHRGTCGLPKDQLLRQGIQENNIGRSSDNINPRLNTFSTDMLSHLSIGYPLGSPQMDLGIKRANYFINDKGAIDLQPYELLHKVRNIELKTPNFREDKLQHDMIDAELKKPSVEPFFATHIDKENFPQFIRASADVAKDSTDYKSMYEHLRTLFGNIDNVTTKLEEKVDDRTRSQDFYSVTSRASVDSQQMKDEQFMRSVKDRDGTKPMKRLEGFSVGFDTKQDNPKKTQKYAKKGELKSGVSRLITLEDMRRKQKEEEMEKRRILKTVGDKNQNEKYHHPFEIAAQHSAETIADKISKLNELIKKEREKGRLNKTEKECQKGEKCSDAIIEKERVMKFGDANTQLTFMENYFDGNSHREYLGGQNIESGNTNPNNPQGSYKNQAYRLTSKSYEPITYTPEKFPQIFGHFPGNVNMTPNKETNFTNVQNTAPSHVVLATQRNFQVDPEPRIASTTSQKTEESSPDVYFKKYSVDQIQQDFSHTVVPKIDRMGSFKSRGDMQNEATSPQKQYPPNHSASDIVPPAVVNQILGNSVSISNIEKSQEESLHRRDQKESKFLTPEERIPESINVESDVEDEFDDSDIESKLINYDHIQTGHPDATREESQMNSNIRQSLIEDKYYPIISQRGTNTKQNQKIVEMSKRINNPSKKAIKHSTNVRTNISSDKRINTHSEDTQYSQFNHPIEENINQRSEYQDKMKHLTERKINNPSKERINDFIDKRTSQKYYKRKQHNLDSNEKRLTKKRNFDKYESKRMQNKQNSQKYYYGGESDHRQVTNLSTAQIVPTAGVNDPHNEPVKVHGIVKSKYNQEQMKVKIETGEGVKKKPKINIDTRHKMKGVRMTCKNRGAVKQIKLRLKEEEVKASKIGTVIEKDSMAPVDEKIEIPSKGYNWQTERIDINLNSEKEDVKNHLDKVIKIVNDMKTKPKTENYKKLQQSHRTNHSLENKNNVDELKNALHRLKDHITVKI